MVTLRPIAAQALPRCVHVAFEGDKDLIDTYHLVNGSFYGCVESTVGQIRIVEENCPGKLNYYGVELEGILIGFTVTGENFLLGFGINIICRTQAIVLDWWDEVCKMFHGEFVTWIFTKNTRALRFLQRNGMEIVEDHGDFVGLVYYDPATQSPINQALCQQED